MRDALLMFGSISLATKDTTVYSADTLDLEDPTNQHIGREGNVVVVFRAKAAFAATDGMIPIIQTSDDNSTWKTILSGPDVAKPVKDQTMLLPFPIEHSRYIRVGAIPSSSGTFTAKSVDAWIELGR